MHLRSAYFSLMMAVAGIDPIMLLACMKLSWHRRSRQLHLPPDAWWREEEHLRLAVAVPHHRIGLRMHQNVLPSLVLNAEF
jgi:hypothetical protein